MFGSLILVLLEVLYGLSIFLPQLIPSPSPSMKGSLPLLLIAAAVLAVYGRFIATRTHDREIVKMLPIIEAAYFVLFGLAVVGSVSSWLGLTISGLLSSPEITRLALTNLMVVVLLFLVVLTLLLIMILGTLFDLSSERRSTRRGRLRHLLILAATIFSHHLFRALDSPAEAALLLGLTLLLAAYSIHIGYSLWWGSRSTG